VGLRSLSVELRQLPHSDKGLLKPLSSPSNGSPHEVRGNNLMPFPRRFLPNQFFHKKFSKTCGANALSRYQKRAVY